MADSSLAIAQEAAAFTQTTFGKHYVARLERVRDEFRRRAENVSMTESESRAYSLKASAYDDELGYFRTAVEIVSTPSLVKRLKDKLKARGDTSV